MLEHIQYRRRCLALVLIAMAWGRLELVAGELKDPTERELQKHVGQSVSVRGKLSLRGKTGPFVLVGGRPIYLEAPEGFHWGEAFTRMEDRVVRATGVLRFVRYPRPERSSSRVAVAQRPDHFAFEAETTTIELAP